MSVELVRLNSEKLLADIAAMKVQKKQLSHALGFGETYIHDLIRRDSAIPRSRVEAIEKALFKSPGTYCIQLENAHPTIKDRESKDNFSGGG